MQEEKSSSYKEEKEKTVIKEEKNKNTGKSQLKKDIVIKDNTEDLGEIKIAPEVLANIVSRIVINTKGVVGLVSGSKSGIGTLLGVKETEEGIKVDLINNKTMSTYISVVIEYGSTIIEVAKNIQSLLKKEIEKNTGIAVQSVDVNVMGIQISKKNNKN
ncbi:MAG: Asp23/Gls24 family envelope stress response protein [Atribacterota bacterium]|nr:Asp23/Gls24 family envelope stress response protein [Atribacterota bacterium]